MSAETTNTDEQTKRHRPSLWGMGLAVAIVAVLFLVFLTSLVATPGDDVEQVISTERVGE